MSSDRNDVLDQKIQTIIEYGQSLIGTPYKWWIQEGNQGVPQEGSPFYSDNEEYSLDYIKEHGMNCAGLINLLAKKVGVKPKGGTIMWMGLHVTNLEIFKPDLIESYPKGTLLLRKYASATDQGHLAVYIGENKVLHAYPNYPHIQEDLIGPGVMIESLDNSLKWSADYDDTENPFYDYVLRPEHWLMS